MRIVSSRWSWRFCQKRRLRYCEREHRDAEARFGFVKANQAHYSVRVMCRMLKVSTSGFYAWLGRPLSARAREDLGLTALIHTIHRRSKGVYGAPSMHAELADDHGRHVGRKRVACLMRAAKLRGATLRRFVCTTTSDSTTRPTADLVERRFAATGPDQLWVADITYVPTWTGFLYLAVVLDVWSRRVVGWAMATHLRTELVLSALNMALYQRRPQNVIHHYRSRLPIHQLCLWQTLPRNGRNAVHGFGGRCV